MGKVLRSILLIVVLTGCGSGVAALLYSARTKPPRREAAALAPVVDSVVVHREDVTEWLAGYGTALPDRLATLAAEVAATVVERVNDLEAGSMVQEDQPLIRLDDREYRHTLERARALAAADQAAIDELEAETRALQGLRQTAENELRVAADEKRRVADLFERDLAAKKEFDFANLAYQRASRTLQGFEMELAKTGHRIERSAASKRSREAEAELAELNIKRCTISAPFSGTIQELQVDRGDWVGPGSPLITLIDPSHVEIPIRLPASVYDQIAVGAPCVLRCDSLEGISWHGEASRIGPLVDERTRTFPVYLDVDNTAQSQPLVPGMFVSAQVRGREVVDRILIPRGAIRDGRILVIQGGIARERVVSVDRIIGDRAVVAGDIRDGEHVIVSHLSQLEDGSAVRIHTALASPRGERRPHGTAFQPMPGEASGVSP